VYALDEHAVLRRYRRRNVPDEEVAIIQHVRASGFPTPAVVSHDGRDLVLERVDGPTMRDDLERDIARLRELAATLATLHRRLHAIAAPEWLRAIGPGDTVVHLEVHPEHVLMGTRSPQVIDWANARRRHWADDVAQTVVILAGALVPEPIAAAVQIFVDAFLEGFDRDEVWAHLDAAIARRVADPNLN